MTPYAIDRDEAPVATLERAPDLRLGPWRVLLAEDDAEMRELLRDVLEGEGYQVVLAEDGDALSDRLGDRWLGEDYDLVLSDVRMPGRTGLDALAELREHDWATPVLLMTAFGDAATHTRARRLHAEVIDKPFALEELVAHVEHYLPPGL
ncbi:MAG: response regulator [Planctomycetota bacterium]